MMFPFGMGHDVRLACRTLMKQPRFSLMIVGILAVGVAGMTTIFSLFNGLFLRPFPVPHQDRIVGLSEADVKTGAQTQVYPRFEAWRQHNRTFECMGFCSFWAANVSLPDKAERINMRLASHDFLRVLSLRPVLGRYFTAEEDRQGGPNVVLLSFGFWKRQFGQDPSVLGRTLTLDGDPYTIIGVLPPEADFPERKEIWQPLRPDAQGRHGGLGTWAIGLLKEGITVEQARQDLTAIHQGWIRQHAEEEITTLPAVTLLRETFRQGVKQYRIGLSILLAVVGFAMLTACCNVMSIMLARGAFQTKEFAMRAALGASRGRIIRQVLAESLVLSAIGGGIGILLGNHALGLLLSRAVDQIPQWMRFPLDVRCGLFVAAVVVVTTILSGLLPAFYAAFPKHLHSMLQSASTRVTVSRSRRQTLNAIVTAEVALASMLLIGAGLLLRTFHQVKSIDPGFRPAGALTYNITLPIGPYFDENKRRSFWDQHLDRVRALSGVTQAALGDYLPMTWPSFGKFEIEGATPPDDGEATPSFLKQTVTPGYFETLGIRLLAGRLFADSDVQKDSEKVAIVNETLAKRFWHGENPLDRRIRPRNSPDWIRVVGVTADVINGGPDQPVWPAVYRPPSSDVPFVMFGIARTSGDPLALVSSIRQIVRAADSGLPVQDVRTLSRLLSDSMWLRHLICWVFGVPAVAAGIMAFAGLYGVISYSVNRRVQEIGVRVALGAGVPDITGMFLRQGFRFIAVGLTFGVVGGFLLSRLFAGLPGMLYNVSPNDPVTFLGVVVLLTAVALAACYLPARRAAKSEPMAALRCE